MGAFVANKVVKLMIKKGIHVNAAKALVLGITFKENCPDIRNSKVIDIITELNDFGVQVDVFDPMANAHEVAEEYGINLLGALQLGIYDTIIMAVNHAQFSDLNIAEIGKSNVVVYDVKSTLPKTVTDGRL
jgi:UDP-N-acetyl-D-galactosamine dehydrogenase